MSETVPEGWRFNSIAECCEILDSQRIPLNSEERSKRLGEYPYYGANGIQGYIDDFIFDGDAILVAEDGGNFDQYAERPIAQWVTGKYWVNNHAHILRAKENDLDKWIFYSLVHKNILKFINGGTRAKLNQSDLREIQISLPPLPEQKKIASILTSVDEVIETTQKQIDKLQDLKKATMNELLTKGIGHTEFKESELGKIPKSWEGIKLGELFVLTSGKSKPTRLLSSEMTKFNAIPVYGGNGVNGYTDSALLDNSTIVIGRVGEYCGCVELTPKHSWITDNALYIKNVLKQYDMLFLFYLMTFSNLSKLKSKGGQPLVSQQPIHEYQVALPPLNEQHSIASIIAAIDGKILVQIQKLNQTQSLKKSLMQDLLTGKVRVQVH